MSRMSTWLSAGSALMLTLLAAAGQANAQAAPAAEPAADPAQPADPVTVPASPPEGNSPQPTQTRAEADPLADQIRRAIAASPKLIEFHGYFRAGIGINSKGGDQVAFGAPGAGSKYRLGNETETYGEFELDNNWVNPDHNDAWFKTAIKLAVVTPRNGTFDTIDAFALREAYVEAGKFVPSHPEMTAWAGQRFYRRKDVHISDFFYNDMSGYGAGFQELKIGANAKLAVAYLGGSVDDMTTNNDIGNPIKNTLDIRVSDIAVGSGNIELWLIPTLGVRSDVAAEANLNRSGIGGGAFWTVPFMGGSNEVSASFGYAGAANLNSSPAPIASDGWLLRLVERATIQGSPQFSMQWTGVLQFDNKNGETNGSGGDMWISAGARPIYNFSKYTAIAVEGGVDIVKPELEGSETGVLGKITVAPMIRPAADFWARPELRAFVTAAFWNDSIAVGGPAYAGDTFGLTAGVQMESWW